MSNAKTERLINLTMALLATRRYMTKSEIFRRVSGYSGSQETKERMFERDKDELRELGIEIEVGGLDPLFEDEAGYRIKRETFQFPSIDFSARELALISTALSLWNETPSEELVSASKKFDSLKPRDVANYDAFTELQMLPITERGIIDVARALSEKRSLSFDYAKPGSANREKRHINPLGLSAWKGSWYVVGEDLDRDDIRAFKLERVVGEIEMSHESGLYEIPEDFDVKDYLVMFRENEYRTLLRIRKNSAISLRDRADTTTVIDDEWDEVKILFGSKEEAAQEILWNNDSVIVCEPLELRETVIETLTKVIRNHE